MASLDSMITVKREPEAHPITFGDAVLLMIIAFWLFQAPKISGWVVFLAFVLAWVTNLIYRVLYPLAEYAGSAFVFWLIQRKRRGGAA